MTFLILVHAINCRALREPGWTIKNLKTLKTNNTLWLSIIVGSLLVFPVVYIPGLNRNVFKHTDISYEWGLVIVDVILFILFAELYKFIKRRVMKPLSGGTDANTEMDRMRTYTMQADSVMELGHVRLIFIPLPSNRPLAPPEPSTTIPAEVRHRTVPFPYVASPPSVPYPVLQPTLNSRTTGTSVTFVDATPIDMSRGKFKLSPAAGGSTIFEDMRNPPKKVS
ncbi:Na+ ATPase [Podila clonocystis]|nr:Na+ ATPase [Podila clonocystis]